ncbi:hypothetical protein ACU21_05005 [Actinobaculum suis]|nr:hypothetical protein ACU20_00910 [Actinobaculum suis]OCA95305.1 hypothetical protein ACU21_05005 [Actinobaculum suis]
MPSLRCAAAVFNYWHLLRAGGTRGARTELCTGDPAGSLGRCNSHTEGYCTAASGPLLAPRPHLAVKSSISAGKAINAGGPISIGRKEMEKLAAASGSAWLVQTYSGKKVSLRYRAGSGAILFRADGCARAVHAYNRAAMKL